GQGTPRRVPPGVRRGSAAILRSAGASSEGWTSSCAQYGRFAGRFNRPGAPLARRSLLSAAARIPRPQDRRLRPDGPDTVTGWLTTSRSVIVPKVQSVRSKGAL